MMAISQGAQSIYGLGEQIVEYAPQAFETIKNLFETGKQYADGSKQFDTKGSSVNQQLKNDTTTVIKNGVISLVNLERLGTLIKLPGTIVITLNKVELHSQPKKKPKEVPPPKGQEIWLKRERNGEKICWECFGIVLLRPRKSLKELRQLNKGTGKIYPAQSK